ncbi:MAG: AAA family ATPase [Flavobacteriaceae bacterium]|jgi:shikimate kinase|nr:AAA family ATPase [Flavobacteriaceae bacterium]
MLISLLGYMGSGKSHISKMLSQKIGFDLMDLDTEIAKKIGMSVLEIFEKKGEIFFRKEEREVLENLLNTTENTVISLGGGTPAYFNNMEIINEKSESIFLRTSVKTLSERLLKQKNRRPLISKISDENLPEFIAKHLFERNPFYNKAKITINSDDKTAEQICEEIASRLKIIN